METKFSIVFERLKLIRLDENILCKPFWLKVMKLKKNFNEKQCWNLFVDNIEWLLNAHQHYGLNDPILTTSDIKTWFEESILNENGIYTKGGINIVDRKVIGLGSVIINATGHSKVVLFDSAHANCHDTTFVSGFQSSSFVVNDCIGNAFDNCIAKARGLSIVENWTENTVDYAINSLVVNR